VTVAAQTKLHLIHALVRGRIFDGQFEAGDRVVSFTFVPSKASLASERFIITGRIGFALPKAPPRYIDGVTATLMASQGGVGVSPVRRQLLTGTAQTAQTATSDQRLEQEKGPETELQPGLHSFEAPRYDESGRPRVESTDALAFVGVLYLKLSPIDGSALGIQLDMSDIQLGLRLAPTDDLAREIQLLFSDALMALSVKNDELLTSAVAGLNRAFGL
jgi:hypothetical protein